MGAKSLSSLIFGLLAACSLAGPVCAQDDPLDAVPPAAAIRAGEAVAPLPAAAEPAPVNVLLAVHRTAAQRASDLRRRRPMARLVRTRVQDDKNFTNRTRFLAHRMADAGKHPVERGVATTGAE